MYQIELTHEGLNKYRLIKGNEREVVEQKARSQMAQWNEMWARRQAAAEKQAQREQSASEREAKKRLAAERSDEAQAAIAAMRHLLQDTLSVNDAIDWEELKDHSEFATPQPKPAAKPEELPPLKPPREPKSADPKYNPKITLLDRLFPHRAHAKIDASEVLFREDHDSWRREMDAIPERERARSAKYKAALRTWRAHTKSLLAKWQAEKDAFDQDRTLRNAAIDRRRVEYFAASPAAIVEYCEFVLWRSRYPDEFPRDYELDYVQATRTLIVDFSLPSPEQVPSIKEVKYIQSRDDIQEVPMLRADFNELYDDILYQIALRTIHELYEADAVRAIDSVAFNGYVSSVDRATGKPTHACVLSLQTKRDEFLGVDLGKIVPKACFKKLKGVGAAELHSLTAIAPIVQMSREDKRFVAAHSVAQELNEGFNLGAMDWEDFEHLIRELFEKELAYAGGEVKVTRASRDGGVDAVAFDPDPIRGGKIIIQAKRYTNTVGVAAVRDLYGTVVNEGASKGILVTTADYGPDAYEFARNKPLTLLNGGNLLHLLDKHGHKARIDLKEAKQILGEMTNGG